MSYSAPCVARKKNGIAAPDTFWLSPPFEAVDQELAGRHAVVEDADHAVGHAEADDAPVLAGDVGEGTAHIHALTANCSRWRSVLVLLLIWPVKFSRISIAAP